ncbi:DNA-directed RNA polymerase specialized sigma24 family protein [Pararhizobium capsulatum DSM 1112]|uniref:DNA-directed RNA polymerase specialized sigma24 family protein n=1 Tax=Pararhizobium capsulatum DSM 1112 TaxID=1121113 RepID=A0ABU0BLY0_9HYPH|nr:response regulator [Pararhizobium capsulatum]MDQ0319242.1 DNA-directed RNA polymerase specialized sigma24 family protein [Pararhizobium capsulatum DSM 1112]
MSLSMRIAAHLPYLRRFSRAITGSQASGDAYVAAMLEALIADISLFPEGPNDRVSVFKLFCGQLDKMTITLPETPSPFRWETRAAANLAKISPAARKAFLLASVEGFSTGETAEILDISEGEAEALLERASQDISRQVATDIMIIEDEPLIAMDIEDMISSLGHRVAGVARTHAEAVALFNRAKPKMILADIQLADGSSGIDAVNEILADATVPVIFITAFPERLLTGTKPEPAFLVTKPFNPEMVKALISQALFFDENANAPHHKA